MTILIRKEIESDYRVVEEITREAFWNLYVPGCDEHYLVHILRRHSDFVSELDFVAEFEGKVIGNIMYTRSHVVNQSGEKLDTLTFGPISVLPEYQRRGVGGALISHTKDIALKNSQKAIIIQGHPHNYCRYGFRSSRDFGVSDSSGRYPYGLLVLELEKGIFRDAQWKYFSSSAYAVKSPDVEAFDKQFCTKKKENKYTQEEFSIAVRAYLD